MEMRLRAHVFLRMLSYYVPFELLEIRPYPKLRQSSTSETQWWGGNWAWGGRKLRASTRTRCGSIDSTCGEEHQLLCNLIRISSPQRLA